MFVAIADAEKNLALGGQDSAGGELPLGERDAEALADAHDFARAAHLWAQDDIDAREFAERKHAFLHAYMMRNRLLRQTQLWQLHAGHDLGGELRQRHAG